MTSEKASTAAPAPNPAAQAEASSPKRRDVVTPTATRRNTFILHDASTVDVYVRLEPSGPLFVFHREVLSENEALALPEIYLEPETLKTQFWMFYENGVELEFEELVAFPSIWKDVTTSDALTPSRIPLARFGSLLGTLANVDGESRLRLLLLYASRGAWNLQRIASLKRMTFTEITRATKDTTISRSSLSKMSQDFPKIFNEVVPAVVFSTRECVHCKSQVEIFRSGWNKASLYSVRLGCGCEIQYYSSNGQSIETMTGTIGTKPS
ncbi:hypothetical protein HDU96_010036 [Phlyctochytrium bullatum]|nr:hypothetical protein HDU96_010036 [Phlyctochytrium bullatum]